ncbi:glycosyltransferase family 4 protein [Hyunsoonleella sp. SJ7]|uniref:Glycosyltransferase family 4 protein n=1 Tax=Hyunsoonleella aquatilis TaxID=2762758 RepID=A0A923HFL0_9FLAO|nr:glycosyltransferase family 4 protein [Hyunsoonleella aquatilis]MBC3758490.1 glycosyltransferase family 4 protein [Hyunsoonleella aquatilis]
MVKKKICIVRAGDVTFISRIHRTALALQERGNYDVTIVSITPRDNLKRRDYPYQMNYIDIKARAIRSSIFSVLRIVEGLIKLFFSALKQKADLYIAIGIEDLVIIYFVTKLTGAKFIYSANELEGDRKRASNLKLNQKLNNVVIKVERFILKKAECVIAADIERAKLMERWYKLDKVDVVRNVPIPEEIAESDLIRKKLNIPEDQKVLLYQGLLASGRGLEVAIEACSKIKSDNSHLVFLGFITDSYKEKLVRLARENNLDRFHILPPVPWRELLFWTKSADISLALIENVSISYYLAAPNKLYESIMVGIPYIASDFPEIRHVQRVAKSGILVDPENVNEISKAIDKLISNSFYYKQCIENSRQARHVFNWNNEKIKLLNIVDRILLA